MPVHERQQPPGGHGEVLCSPPYEQWAELVDSNRAMLSLLPPALAELRGAARAETRDAAARYSASLRIEPPAPATSDVLLLTGHQPELYHPGVWVKGFLAQRFADEHGATALDIVVDTDAAGSLDVRMPCLVPRVSVCRHRVVEGAGESAYVQLPPPGPGARAELREVGERALETLPAPALRRHFASFCDALDTAAGFTHDLAACMTAARRLYERPAGTDYLELAVSAQVRTDAYRRFAASLLLDAGRFRRVMNTALGEYRRRTGTRSQAQPFPDLAEAEGRIDVPFWLLDGSQRLGLAIGEGGVLYAGGAPVTELGTHEDGAADRLGAEGLLIAPKAIALTLFERLFVADLFVHGTGGARYDRVTDAVIAQYYGIAPPAFAVASMTMLLPLGARLATGEDITALEQRIHRFTHNPDQVLGELEFDTVDERLRAEDLAREKRELVTAIAAQDADRKALGGRIRAVNEALGELLRPMVEELDGTLDRLRAERNAAEVLTDRTYPYCLWDPREVMDKVR